MGPQRHPYRENAAAVEDQMITVKLYGLLRLDSGIRELSLEAKTVSELCSRLPEKTDRITKKDLGGCVFLVNGKVSGRRTKLTDGDVVQLMPPVAGG